jgi:hypothetical protein
VGPVRSVGVVLVHGIGEQKQGGTLRGFGEPTLKWMKRWLGPVVEDDPVRVTETVLKPGPGKTPPHTRATVKLNKGGSQVEILFAEAHWAGVFDPPSYSQVTNWGLTFGPRLVGWYASEMPRALTHVATRARAKDGKDLGWRDGIQYVALLARGLATLAFLGFVLVLWLFILLTTVFAFVPKLRDAVRSLQLLLANYLGDCHTLVESELSYDAMSTNVEQTIQWVSDRSDVVAVLAHSQGAAVAHRALMKGGSPGVELLVTFGAGIKPLLGQRDHIRGFWSALGLLLKSFFASVKDDVPLSVGDKQLALPGVQAGTMRWLDVWATGDPVPVGPLSLTPPEGITSIPVVNRWSPLSDHTGYFHNTDDFVARVASSIVSLAGVQLLESRPAGRDNVESARVRREWRVGALTPARLLCVGLLPAAALMTLGRERWEDLVRPVASIVARGLAAIVPVVSERGMERVFESSVCLAALAFIGALFVGFLAYRLVFKPAWAGWQSNEESRLFDGRTSTPGRWVFATCFVASALAAGFVPLLLPASASPGWLALIGLGVALLLVAFSWKNLRIPD